MRSAERHFGQVPLERVPLEQQAAEPVLIAPAS
jgi:hypothetical protein